MTGLQSYDRDFFGINLILGALVGVAALVVLAGIGLAWGSASDLPFSFPSVATG